MKHRIDEIIKAYGLKNLKRTGWLQSGIDPDMVETVASHSWGMAFLFSVLEPDLPQEIDRYRSLKMAVLHDLAESSVGDITPQDGISAGEKQRIERAALQELVAPHPQGAGLLELWDEFEAGATLEAQTIKALDKLDMLIQATIYEQETGVDLDSFWENTDALFKEGVFKTIYEHIRMNRRKFKGINS